VVRVRRVVDLTLPLDDRTTVYPGDPATDIRTEGPDDAGFHVTSIGVGSHTGTHCDAPFHFVADGARIDEVDLGLFAGPMVVIDVRGRADRSVIGVDDVAPSLGLLGAGRIAVLHTGWTQHYGAPRYFDHPHLAPEACEAILATGARTIGVDALSIDETGDDEHPGSGWPCHGLVLGSGGVLLENLAHLDRVDFARPFLSALPLRITGADGSPIRAAAFDLADDEDGSGRG
jgi:kynurenine formamidase